MTDIANTAGGGSEPEMTLSTNPSLMKKRRAAEKRFQWLGISAIGIACLFLVFLLSTIVMQGLPAFWYNYAKVPVDLSSVSAEEPRNSDYDQIFKASVSEVLPFMSGRSDKRAARGLFAAASGYGIFKQVLADTSLAGTRTELCLPLSDFADLYLKGDISKVERIELSSITAPIEVDGKLSLDLGERASSFQSALVGVADLASLGNNDPSVLVIGNNSVIKANAFTNGRITGEVLLDYSISPAAVEQPYALIIDRPENLRKFTDKDIAVTEYLKKKGLIESGWNTTFFTAGASREPENAGIWGAVVGSFLTLVVTLLITFPIGVAAAVYLEEFAPKNRGTDIIEVNINNLAAVPSIVFGLLGLAVFLNGFNLPRSAPLVGGMVLALMTLPTIIIATRAALKAVPPSIREGALGIGASKTQVVFHHVLPLAMPGILTGTIIGMAQALGETAPLLMIGMVAFIVDIPGGFTDPSTVLPVQIFMWADFPEPAFGQKTAAAILVLLGFLVLMNAIAVILRKRFERRW